MIECVNIETNHLFEGNPLAAQHRLRYESIISRQQWDVPCVRNMEFDKYDNPAAYYLIYRDDEGVARGVSRLYPTTLPYMLEEAFSFLVTDIDTPRDQQVWEGSRFCVDKNLPPEQRKRIIQEIVVAYLEFGLAMGVKHFIGVMLPAYWRNIFIGSGWDVDFVGAATRLNNADSKTRVRAGRIQVLPEILARVRETTGIYDSVINFGNQQVAAQVAA